MVALCIKSILAFSTHLCLKSQLVKLFWSPTPCTPPLLPKYLLYELSTQDTKLTVRFNLHPLSSPNSKSSSFSFLLFLQITNLYHLSHDTGEIMASFQQTQLYDDSKVLYSTSNSSNDSPSPLSSFSHSTPQSHHPSTTFKLTVSNLCYSVLHKNSLSFLNSHSLHQLKPTNILDSVSFVAKSSEILAVVGPSGAGKSTLLRIISGRVDDVAFLPNSISLNDQSISSPRQLRRTCGFVTQEDNLLSLLTVKETLMFSARFRLKGMNAKDREARVELLMQELGLVHVANSFVGDEETRGISGGERKRVSIGVDVIHDPPILLLDEPTSGLDSSSALQVIELLASMAKTRQQTIIITIHQPSYRILQFISSLLLLSRGLVAHFGTLKSLEETIIQMGYSIPDQLNPIEFAMEIIRPLEDSYNSRSYSSIADSEQSSYLVWLNEEGVFQQKAEEGEFLRKVEESAKADSFHWRMYEVATLCLRFWKIIYRTKQLLLARSMQAIVGGLGLGSVYLKLKADEGGVAERLGLFAFSLSFLLSSTVEALPIFLQERRVLMREVSRGAYKVSSYMIANAIIFIPFLLVVALLFAIPVYWLVGLNPSLSAFMFFVLVVWLIVLMASSLVLFLSAISPDFISGNSLICVVLGAFFLFSGYFIPKENVPRYWLFMYYVSLYRYPLDSLLINEYWSLRGKCFSSQLSGNNSSCPLTGRDVLRIRELERDDRWMNVGIMLGFFFFYRILCWIVLSRMASKTKL